MLAYFSELPRVLFLPSFFTFLFFGLPAAAAVFLDLDIAMRGTGFDLGNRHLPMALQRVKGFARNILLALLALLTLASPAWALSHSCTALNQDLANGATAAPGASLGWPYNQFANGEVVTYSVTTADSVAGDLNGEASAARFRFVEGAPLVEVTTSGGLEATNVSGSIPVSAGKMYFFEMLGSTSGAGTVSVMASCAVPSPVPTITSLSPASGPMAGGESLTITGTNFVVGSTSVTIGSDDFGPADITVNSPTSLSLAVPKSTIAGPVDVSVTTPDGTATLPNGYRYQSNDATLSNLTLTGGTLQPPFNSNTTSYTIALPNSVTSVNLTATTSNSQARLSLGAAVIASGAPTAISLQPLSTMVTLHVTSEDGASAKTYDVTITRDPALVMGPPWLPNGTVTLPYTQPLAASGGFGAYTYAVTAGALPPGLSIAAGGTLGGYPTTAGTYTFAITVTDGRPATVSKSYSVVIDPLPPPLAGAVSATLAANSSANPITLNLAGGAATSVAVYAQAMNGVATASGTTITYKPNPGYSGSDTFKYTATNASGTSSAATVSVTVSRPALVLSPADGASLPSGTWGTAYSPVTLAATLGAAPYTYALYSGVLPAGITVSGAGVISGTPMASGTFYFAVQATDKHGATGLAIYSITVAAPNTAPLVSDSSASVGANSWANLIDLTLSGGIPTSVAITVNASNGNATATGTMITYTPTAGYSGVDSFTYTATNGHGTSAPARVSITVTPVAIVISPSSLPGGTFGSAYSQTLTASGGTGPYSVSITGGVLPLGLTLNAASGVLSGTPRASGTPSITVTATDANTAIGSKSYSLSITGTPQPIAGAVAATVTANSTAAPIPLALSGGAATTVAIAVNGSHGTATASGTSITYTPAAGYSGSDSFTYTASNGTGTSQPATVTVTINPSTVTAADKGVVVPPGSTPVPLDLTVGATGGPFTSANVVGVVPPHAGTASIVGATVAAAGPVATPPGFYLKFIPNPLYSGTAIVNYTLGSALGTSNTAKVSYSMSLDPDRAKKVIGGLSNGFVTSRAGLLAGAADTPGLANRRSAASANMPGTLQASASGNSVTMNFAASTLAASAASSAAESLAMQPVDASGVNFWIDGTATLHVRTDSGADHWGSLALVAAGADLLVNDKLLAGVALHVDWMDDITDMSRVVGTGMLVGPYISTELGEGVFLDASAFYGRSWNEASAGLFRGSFETDRLLAKMRLEGQWTLSEDLVLRPSASAFYLNETAGAYSVSNGAGATVTVDAFTLNQLRLSAGAVLQYTLDVDAITVRPFIGGELGLTFTGTATQSVFSSISGGFDVAGDGNWTLGISTKATFESNSFRALSATGRIGVSF